MKRDVDIQDPWLDARDSYVTDGRRLLRVVSRPGRVRGLRTAIVEDCRTLELQAFSRRELRRLRRLRLRTPPPVKQLTPVG
jgi:hypothetical protein